MAESIVNLGAGSTGQFLDFVLRNRPSYREGDPSAYTMVDGEFQEAPQYSRNTDDKQRMGETYAGRGMDRDYFYEGFTAEPSAGITEKDIQDKVVRLSDLQDEANFGSPYAGETGVFVPQQVEVVDGKVITNPVGFDNGGIVGQLGELSEMSSDMRDEISQLVNGTPASGAGFLGYEGSTSFLGNGPNGMFGFSQPAYAEATPLLTAGSQRPLPPGFGTRPMRDPGNLVDTNATLSLNSLQLPPDFIPPRGMEGMFSPTVSNLDRGSPQIDQGFFNSPEFNAFNSGPQVGTSDMYNSRYFGQMGSGSLGRRQESAYEDYLRRTGQEGSILQPDYNRNVVSLPGSGSGGFGQSIFGFEDGGEVGIMSALLDPRIDLPNSEQQTAVRQSGREGSALSSQFYPEGSLTFEQILETKYGYPSDVDREIYESDSTEVMRAERPRHDLPTYQELEDARAHALQTALLAQDLGPETATKLGGIAEFSDRIFSSATSEDVVMDKRNNAFGAKLLQQAGINATPQQITKMVDDEVFKQLDVVLGREKGERRFKSPESGLDIFFPRDKQGFFNVTR